ncbi:MAG: hypothetical protein ACRC46_03230 [Thermoguttaceae bacterium]
MNTILLAHCFGHDFLTFTVAAFCGGAVTATAMLLVARFRKTQNENVRRDEE